MTEPDNTVLEWPTTVAARQATLAFCFYSFKPYIKLVAKNYKQTLLSACDG